MKTLLITVLILCSTAVLQSCGDREVEFQGGGLGYMSRSGAPAPTSATLLPTIVFKNGKTQDLPLVHTQVFANGVTRISFPELANNYVHASAQEKLGFPTSGENIQKLILTLTYDSASKQTRQQAELTHDQIEAFMNSNQQKLVVQTYKFSKVHIPTATEASCTASANKIVDIKNYRDGAQDLCYNAIDEGPLKCYNNSSASLKLTDVIPLCSGSTLNNYRVVLQCYNESSTGVSDNQSARTCSGAHNLAPAKCTQILVASPRNGKSTRPNVLLDQIKGNDIVTVCSHSIDADATIKILDGFLKNLTMNEAVKATAAYNESKY